MNTTTSVVLTGVTTAAGQWSQSKKIDMRVFVGIGVLAIILSAMGEANEKLAQQFGVLILIGALMIYTLPISKALGYTK